MAGILGFDRLSPNGMGLTGITRYRTNLTPLTLSLSLAQRPGGDRVNLTPFALSLSKGKCTTSKTSDFEYSSNPMGYLLCRGYANDRLSPNGVGLKPMELSRSYRNLKPLIHMILD